MKTINVDVSKKYDVVIGEGVLSSLGERCVSLFGRSRAVIVTDSNVAPLWLDEAKRASTVQGLKRLNLFFLQVKSQKMLKLFRSLLNSWQKTDSPEAILPFSRRRCYG